MKRALSIFVAVIMLVGVMSLSASAALTYNAVYGTAAIDGVVSAGEWDEATAAEMNVCTNPGKKLAKHPTMKIMHDGTYMYVLVEGETPDTDVNTFVCVHVPHDGCTLDGCQSYIKFVVDGKALAKSSTADYQPWTYSKDENFDGVNDYADGTNGGKSSLASVAYKFTNGKFTAEFKVAVNYGNAIPEGEAYVDVRMDAETVWATHQWANQPRTWDTTFNPAYDAGVVYFLAEGEEAPVETEAVETELVTTEPVETEPVTTEPVETEPVTTESVTGDAEEPVEKSSFPIVPVIAVAAVVVLAVVLFFVFKKRK